MGSRFSCSIGIGFNLRDDLVYPLVRIRLAESGARGDHLGNVLAIRCFHFFAVAGTCSKQPLHFATGVIGAALIRRRLLTKQGVDITVHGAGSA